MGAVKSAEAGVRKKKSSVKSKATASAARSSGKHESSKHMEPTEMVETESTEIIEATPAPKGAAKRSRTASAPGGVPILLTEQELIKAPEKEYMSEAQLAFFRDRLQGMERELLRNAGETTEHLRETVIVPDPADRATIEEEHALELRTRDRERKLLKKIQQSIARIDSGEYGYCEETGEPIGVLRLLARPTATLSLEAQERRELKQKLYGD
jgi:DnaK suppressor protein